MFSNILFVLEIIVAEFLMTARLKRNSYYVLRLVGVVLFCLLVAFLIPPLENAWYNFAIYLVIFSLTLIGLKILYREPWLNVVFCGVAAYTVQHLAYQFTNLLFTLILWGESPLLGIYHSSGIDVSSLGWESLFWLLIYGMGYFTTYVLSWFLFARYVNKNEQLKIKKPTLTFLLGGCLILNILLNSLVIFSNEQPLIINTIVRHVAGTFNCLLLLQWQFELVRNKRLESELNFTQRMLSQAKEQYGVSKESIDLVNLKCHDIKHQIREIGSHKQLDPETIRDLEESVNVYDSIIKTDHEALDVILTEKSFKCLSNNIVLNCIADGKILNFMKSSDVYALFGNALDNAIEAVIKLHDKAKRVIGLKVYAVGNMITINVKNFYKGEVLFDDDGLPYTTKVNKDYHGYGMKSIQMIVEKYDGSLSVQASDGVFNLNILLPAY